MNGNRCYFRGKQLRKEWTWDCKFCDSDMSLIVINFGLIYISYYVNFRFNNGPDMSPITAYFLSQFGYYTQLEFFCGCLFSDLYGRLEENFTEIEGLKTVINVLCNVSYKRYASQFWQLVCKCISIRIIQLNILLKREVHRRNLCITNKIIDSRIIRVRYFFFSLRKSITGCCFWTETQYSWL